MTSRTDAAYVQLIADLADLARAARVCYGLHDDVRVDLLSHSENTVFRLTCPRTGWRAVMRIHRPGYHTRVAIRSELDWMTALGDAGIRTPRVIAGNDAEPLQSVSTPVAGTRLVVLFEWVDGEFPHGDGMAQSMQTLGALSARMHRQSRRWGRPAGFERPAWDIDDLVGDAARWGRWQAAPGLQPRDVAILADTERLLRRRLDAFGRTDRCFGLIHADLRAANLLVTQTTTTIIDFDDCGTGWFLHDMASALSFIEHRPDCDRLSYAWAEGYARSGTLLEADVAEFPTFLMLRRLQLLAWMGSHIETDLARSLGQAWVTATAELGERYLRKMS